jgi:hypothetical protein
VGDDWKDLSEISAEYDKFATKRPLIEHEIPQETIKSFKQMAMSHRSLIPHYHCSIDDDLSESISWFYVEADIAVLISKKRNFKS